MESEETGARSRLGEILSKEKFGEVLNHLTGESSSLWRRLLEESGGSFFLKIGKAGLGIVTSIVLARIMGAEGYGAYVYVISWASILAVPGSIGLPPLLTREVARFDAKNDWNALRGVLEWSDRAAVGVCLSLVLLSIGAVWWLGGGLEPQLRRVLWVAVPLPALLAFVQLRKGALKGLGYVIEAQLPILLVLPSLFLFFVVGIYLLQGLDAMIATAVRVLATGLALIFSIVLLRRRTRKQVQEAEASYDSARWIKSALPFLVLDGVNRVNQKIPTIILGTTTGAEAAGIYGVAVRGVFVVTFVRSAINVALAPKVSRLYSEGEVKTLQELIKKCAWLTLILSGLVTSVFIIFGNTFLSVFGDTFMGGYTALCILLIGRMADAGAGSVGLVLSMTGHETDTAMGIGIAMIVNVGMCLLLTPTWGAEGAAVSATISSITWNVILGYVVYERTGLFSSPAIKSIIQYK